MNLKIIGTCSKCGADGVELFEIHAREGSFCYDCRRGHLDHRNELNRQWRKRNADKVKSQAKRYAQKSDYQDIQKNSRLLREYGISLSDYNDLIEKQSGRCAICGKELDHTFGHNAVHVDHCHTTNAVRGVLCRLCNVGLGSFRDDVSSLQKAIRYLENA